MSSSFVRPLQILKASAGSGKTFRLTARFLSLLFLGNNQYRRIMAVTFTNKATAEMKNRILSVLALFAKGDWENAEGYFKEIQKQYPELNKEQIQEKAQSLYRQILHDYGRLTITTIDKFVQQIIRSFTFELGIDPDYQVTLNLKQVAQDLGVMLHQSLDENPKLLEWIIERAKSRINAGKTWNYQKELEQLSLQIFSDNFQPFDATHKAEKSIGSFDRAKQKIEEIKEGLEKPVKLLFREARQIFSAANLENSALKGKSRSPLLSLNKTEKAFIEYLRKSGTTAFDKIIDEEDQWFAKDATESEKSIYPLLNPILKQLSIHLHDRIETYNLALALEDNLYYLRLLKTMSSLLKDYRVKNHVLLISDATQLLEGITQGMEDNPSFIWEKTGNRYRYFLFDEFQDTSRNQWKNFKPLVKNALGEASGKRIEHLIVGDVKQSIYRWRGGDWKILLREAEQSLGKDFVSTESLQTNYRSDSRIIQFNNYIFPFIADWLQNHINSNIQVHVGSIFFETFWKKNGYDHIIQEAYQDVKQEVITGKNANSGIVDWKVFKVENDRHRKSQILDDVMKDTADRLFRWVAEEKRYRPEQVGILVRSNKEAQLLFSFLKNDLQNRNTPNAYSLISGNALKLNDHPAIQLILQTFRLLCQPEKNQGIYQSQCAYLYNLFQKENNQLLSANDWLELGAKKLKKVPPFLPEKVCSSPEKLLQVPLAELLEEVIAAYHLNKKEDALPYLLAFRDHISQFLENGNSGLAEFLEWWDVQEDFSLSSSSEENKSVQIMTIHKAKGLAFDVVILPFLFWTFDGNDKDQVWADFSGTPFAELQTAPLKYGSAFSESVVKDQYFEEQLYCYMDALNTLYVAMTRPRKHLFLSLPGHNHDIKSSSILAGDSMVAALENYQLLNQNDLLFPESEIENNEKPKHVAGWAFETYPIAHHLKKQLDRTAANQLRRLDNDENIRTGIAVHELLSYCHSLKDIKPGLKKMEQEGRFSEKEKTVIEETARKVLADATLQGLLNSSGTFLNERDLLDKDGNTHRPDKVWIGENKTVIIDFKFTGKENSKHEEQVRLYKNLFSEMGYPNVSGYLYYGFQGKLVTV